MVLSVNPHTAKASPAAPSITDSHSTPALGAWKSATPLPQGIGGAALIPFAAGALFAGGETWSDDPTRPAERIKQRLDTILAWDAAQGAWRAAGKLPRPASNYVFGALGTQLFAMGGVDSQALHSELWQGELGQPWRNLGAWSQPAWGNAAVQLGTDLFSIGGWTDPAGKQLSAQLWRWDLTQPAIAPRAGAPLPAAPRALAAAAACGDAVYLFGGLAKQGDDSLELNEAWRYLPAADRWEPLAPQPRFAHAQRATALDARRILIVGGYGGDAAWADATHPLSIFADVWIYDTVANRYTALPDLPLPICDMPVLRLGDSILAVGGEDRARSRAAHTWLGRLDP